MSRFAQPRFVRLGLALCALACGCTGDRAQPDPLTGASVGENPPEHASLGQIAPDFALPDLEGRMIRLADHRGEVVVLEWFNPDCPFVRASHTNGSLRGLAKKYVAQGVVWLAINSAAKGKEGYGVGRTADGMRRYGMEHAVLLDESGDVGHRYGATNTPHMFVIDAHGRLAYRGAIDNSPDGEGESPTGGKLVNYVSDAIDAVRAGRPVAVGETKAYGCSVKY